MGGLCSLSNVLNIPNTTNPLYNLSVVCSSFIVLMKKEQLLKKLGKRIREIRKEKGISQVQLAAEVNKDQQSIQRLEAGKINPSIYYLSEISAGLNTPLSELLSFFN